MSAQPLLPRAKCARMQTWAWLNVDRKRLSAHQVPDLARAALSRRHKAALLGLNWPLEFRASAKGTSKLSDHQRAEALKRIAAGESYRAIAKTFGVHHATVSRLRSRL